jgi:hypothetical protein
MSIVVSNGMSGDDRASGKQSHHHHPEPVEAVGVNGDSSTSTELLSEAVTAPNPSNNGQLNTVFPE